MPAPENGTRILPRSLGLPKFVAARFRAFEEKRLIHPCSMAHPFGFPAECRINHNHPRTRTKRPLLHTVMALN
jgi:hypothetical protein